MPVLLAVLSVAVLAGSFGAGAAYADGHGVMASGEETYPPPLQQQRDGVALLDIKCNSPLDLYVRDSQTAVCITESTYEAMVGLGLDLVPASSVGADADGLIVRDQRAKVQKVVSEAVQMYKDEGEAAFDAINAMRSADPTYPFVFGSDYILVANGAIPELVGLNVLALVTPDRSADVIMAELDAEGGSWVEYRFPNPATGQEERKITWLSEYDGYIFGSGYYVDPARSVMEVVSNAIDLYESQGKDVFATINALSAEPTTHYPFVLDISAGTIASHGFQPERVGEQSILLNATSDHPPQTVLERLQTGVGVWVEYVYEDPVDKVDRFKRSWMVLHDGYAFGAGYYLSPDARVQEVVDRTVQMYKDDGAAAFDAINAMRSSDPTYPFVIEYDTLTLVANGAVPELVGLNVLSISTPDRPLEEIVADIESDGVAWVEYRFPNPATGQEERKITWLTAYDGYVFASGYYIDPVTAVKASVDDALALYATLGKDAFVAIDAMSADPTPYYPFVLSAEDGSVLAHGAFPERVGIQSVILGDSATASDPPEVILERLREGTGTWTDYSFQDPTDGTEKHKRTWLFLRDGYVFGAGYYLSSEAWVQGVVDDVVRQYEVEGEKATFAAVSAMRSTEASYPFIYTLDGRVLVAHGANPDLVGEALDDLIKPDRPFEEISADLERDGWAWMKYTFPNPATGQEERKTSWLVLHNGYVFSSGYYEPLESPSAVAVSELEDLLALTSDPGPADVRKVVDAAVRLYEADPENAFELINGLSDLNVLHYPFVLDLERNTIAAHGSDISLVGERSQILGGTFTANPIEVTLAQIAADGGAWSDYVFINPTTGLDQLKRTWFVEHDGYLFGSGYYYSLEERALNIIENTIALIKSEGPEAAFEIINGETDRVKYATVIDAEAEEYVAVGGPRKHLVGTQLVGRTTIPVSDAIDLLKEYGGSVWVYTSVSAPNTDITRQVTALLTYRDGYVMYQGYAYPAEEKVRFIVKNTIHQYNSDKTGTLEGVTGTSLDPHYPFIVDAATKRIVSHGADPDRVGEISRFFDEGFTSKSFDEIMAEMEANGGAWVDYKYPFPGSSIDVEKRSWLELHDGYIFGSGFYQSLYISHPRSLLN